VGDVAASALEAGAAAAVDGAACDVGASGDASATAPPTIGGVAAPAAWERASARGREAIGSLGPASWVRAAGIAGRRSTGPIRTTGNSRQIQLSLKLAF